MHLPKSQLLKLGPLKKAVSENQKVLTTFKSALKYAHARLEEHQHRGISSAQIVEKHTWVVDELIQLAWRHHCPEEQRSEMSLVAVGGYGRGELHPYSDVDLLILLRKNDYAASQPVVEPFLRLLWDIGLEIGHSVRTVRDCVKESRADITVMTTLLESRYLSGATDLLETLDDKLRNKRLWSADKFYQAKLNEQEERHAAYQDTAYSLEPNIKESPGGLRDLQTILWVYNRAFGVRSFREMKEQGHLDENEYRLLIRARNVLWKLRSGLHLHNHRREDRLLFDHQRQLAADYGYEDTPSHLAVEQLMKRYYRTAKNIIYLNEVLLSHYRVNHSKRFSLGVSRSIHKDFIARNKMIEAKDIRLFERKPASMLRLFKVMQEHRIKEIHPDTIRAIRSNLDKITPQFRADPSCKKLFLELFQDFGTGLSTSLSRMNAYGLLGAYLPTFGAIVGQMQHDLFHVYTVDGHTLMVLQNLVRLREETDTFPLPSRLLTNIYKPERLFIAALFHDIAKGRGGDHSILGEKDAYRFCIEHGLTEYDAGLVGWLVLNHLVMSHFSQRRDISDPEVIQEFAELVGDHEHLDNLYLLTHADIRGTSPKVWNAWKGQLLMDLYKATSQALRRGVAKPINEEQHVEDDKVSALRELEQMLTGNYSKATEQRVTEFWSTLSNDYFIRNEPFYIAWHAAALCNQGAIEIPIVSVRFSERLEANMIFVFAPESPRLLTRVTHAFDKLDLSIIEAQLQSSENGFALYSFNATTKDSNGIQDYGAMRNLEQRLRYLLLQAAPKTLIVRRNVSRALKHFPIQSRIRFSQNHQNYTAMEVVAQDQPGLLHNVAMVLQRQNIKAVSAKIATFGERAEDVFFIQLPDGKPVTDEQVLQKLEQELTSTLNCQGTEKPHTTSTTHRGVRSI